MSTTNAKTGALALRAIFAKLYACDSFKKCTQRIDRIVVASGSYTLLVTAFVSEKKADQPLKISGSWECAFTK